MSFRICLISVFSLMASMAGATEVKGAGSSAAQPLYKALAEQYSKTQPMEFVYQPSGSSDGLKQIKANSVDFGASDVALSAEERQVAKLICFPTAISGVVPVVNLAGLHKVQLQLTGDVLADIFSRKIVKWNDPRLKALNASVSLPELAISVVVRSDGSGTTYNFTDYLSKISPAWASAYGRNFTIVWPAGVVTAKGSSGVVAMLKETPGGIAYVDYQYAVQSGLSVTALKNRDGKFVLPSAAGFSAALANSSWKSSARYEELLTDRPGAGSWPITAGTFVLVPRQSRHPEATIAVLSFFTWAFVHGDTALGKADFVKLPESVQARIVGELMTVTDGSGAPLRWSLSDVLKLR